MTTPPAESPESPASGATSPEPAPTPVHPCSHCGAPLVDDQDWCLDCGAARPGALRTRNPARAGVMLAALTSVLVIAAAGAAYAALRTPPKRIVLKAAAPATPAPAATAPTATGTITGPSGTTTPSPPAVTPPATTKTPSIPKVTAPTVTPPPATSVTEKAPTVTPAPVTSAPKVTTSTTTTHTASGPTPLLLDSDATSDYNPNDYPSESFGDPSLAIDGDTTTAWSAQVPTQPSPGGDAGLLVDLKSQQPLTKLKLITDTPGATFVVLGTSGSQAPATIAAAGWTKLSAPIAVKRTQTFTLATKGHRYRWLVLWILGVKGGPTATLPPAVATTASAATSSSTALLVEGSSATGAATGTSTTAAGTGPTTSSTTTSSSTTNSSPLVTVDVSELSIYP